MDEQRLLLMLGEIKGSIDATNKSVDDKFSTIVGDIKEQKIATMQQEVRLGSLETDRKWVTKLAGVVGALVSIIVTAIINICIIIF